MPSKCSESDAWHVRWSDIIGAVGVTLTHFMKKMSLHRRWTGGWATARLTQQERVGTADLLEGLDVRVGEQECDEVWHQLLHRLLGRHLACTACNTSCGPTSSCLLYTQSVCLFSYTCI